MREDSFTVGLLQMRADADPEANVARAVAGIHKAAAAGAQIICLQELFRTPYFCRQQSPALFDLAETIPGPTSEKLSEAAAETETVVIGSVFEKRSPGVCHNTAVIFDANGRMVGFYRKMHIPDDPLYFEKYYFTPGPPA
jgi:N-carbamoylputrescine amidase